MTPPLNPIIYVRVYDRNHALLPGADIRFTLNGQAAGGVESSDGRGMIQLPNRDAELEVTVTYGGQTQNKKPAKNVQTIEFDFDVDGGPKDDESGRDPDGGQKNDEPGKDPEGFLRLAIKAVPATKYALGLAGFAAAGSIAAQYLGSPTAAVIGTSVTIAGSVIVLVFARLVALKKEVFLRPAQFLMWAMTVMFVAAITLLGSSFFVGLPLDLRPTRAPVAPPASGAPTGKSKDEAQRDTTDMPKAETPKVSATAPQKRAASGCSPVLTRNSPFSDKATKIFSNIKGRAAWVFLGRMREDQSYSEGPYWKAKGQEVPRSVPQVGAWIAIVAKRELFARGPRSPEKDLTEQPLTVNDDGLPDGASIGASLPACSVVLVKKVEAHPSSDAATTAVWARIEAVPDLR